MQGMIFVANRDVFGVSQRMEGRGERAARLHESTEADDDSFP